MKNYTPSKRVLAMFLAVVILMISLPVVVSAASSEEVYLADASTYHDWKKFFGKDVFSTENAGSVWMDKSVYNTNAFSAQGVQFTPNGRNFLVALSAIASNSITTGAATKPIDTVFILDASGSMSQGVNGNKLSDEMIEAANESIHVLMEANDYNRISVVLYSGSSSSISNNNAATTLLPLDHYTTSGSVYLDHSNASNGTVSVSSSVRNSSGNAPTSVSKSITGATYIQKGLAAAEQMLTDEDNATTLAISGGGTVNRIPVLVLMSDGDPTLADTDFTNPGQYNLGDGSDSSSSVGFATQLTAAYVKASIEEKYNEECLFYTLGLAVDADSMAEAVLNPANSTATLDYFWESYQNASVGERIYLTMFRTITKVATPLEQHYVDEYFSVQGAESDLAEGLKTAFSQIVGEIMLKSTYYPTLVEGNEDFDGYVAFVDRAGQYMSVNDIKGILIHDTLFSGARLSRNFVPGGGDLGQFDAPQELGVELVTSIMVRLGLDSYEEAANLIRLAYRYGQISYTDDNNFSNYVGWYANADNEFLGFWHEGSTTVPESTGNPDTDPVYYVRSYMFLGEVNAEQGVSESDLMYTTVRVRHNIETGEEVISFAVPAALIPVVTYNVSLDENDDFIGLTVSGADHPIALLYEISLDESIHRFNVNDVVDSEYLLKNTVDGAVNFYASSFEAINSTNYRSKNPYGYFSPSRQNERYYYLEDSLVYANASGTVYSGAAPSAGNTYYRSYKFYRMNGATPVVETRFVPIAEEVLSTIVAGAGGTWVIPKNNVRYDLSRFLDPKENNVTATLPNANDPTVEISGHALDDVNHSFVVGYTLGNNGKLSLIPETGIRLSKTVTETVAGAADAFVFTITTSRANFNETVTGLRESAAGSEEVSVTFVNSVATVTLADGESIYIGGLSATDRYLIEENYHADYTVATINGQSVTSPSIEVTLTLGEIYEVAYVNVPRMYGTLTVNKIVTHPFGGSVAYDAAHSFPVRIQLEGNGLIGESFTVKHSGNANLTSVLIPATGLVEILLKHGEQFEIYGLPEGTVATVTEYSIPDGYTNSYRENGVAGGDGIVTIPNGNVTVTIYNDYTADPVSAAITVNGEKILQDLTGARGWLPSDEFSFRLQQWDATQETWINMGDIVTVSGTSQEKTFTFNDVFQGKTYDGIGIYLYRVIEIIPDTPIPGISYDRTVHSFRVEVTDEDWDGALEIKSVEGERDSVDVTQDASGFHVSLTFTNTYSNSGEDTIAVELQKILVNDAGSPLVGFSGYQFGLFETPDGTTPLFVSEMTNARGFSRLILTYDDEGTYRYYLKEIVPQNTIPNMIYDDTVYIVNVQVSDNGVGGLAALVWLGDSTTPPAGASDTISCDFVNRYLPLSVDFVPEVEKVLNGREPVKGEFTFHLVEPGSSTPVLVGTNEQNGTVTWSDSITFTKVGVYRYDIYELAGNVGGVTYDPTVYRLRLSVTDENGRLTVDVEILNELLDKISFVNDYTPLPVEMSFNGVKNMQGRSLLNDEFSFIMEQCDAQGNVLAQGFKATALNTVAGTFSFGSIRYTSSGVYYYLVQEEQRNGSNGVVYDTNKFLITVEVVDDQVGNLTATKSIRVLNGSPVQDIVFHNKYVPNPIQYPLDGNKLLTGATLKEGTFTFELYQVNDDSFTVGASQLPIDTAQNAAASEGGAFSFDSITFTSQGTYYYVIREKDAGAVKDGVHYDTQEFRIAITVSDNHLGVLSARRLILNSDNIPVDKIEFVNEYKISGNVTHQITGDKTVTGDSYTMQAGEFTFQLFPVDDDSFTVQAGATPTEEVTCDDAGDFAFSTMTFQQVGTYYFVVVEKAGDVEGMTYSEQKYCITIEVTDNGVGGLVKTVTVSESGESANSVSFENKYQKLTPPPQTADGTQLMLWIALAFVSSSGLFYVKKRKESR